MYIVRPKGMLTTPKVLAAELGRHWRSRFYPNTRRPRIFSFRDDFFMTPVHPEKVRHAGAYYQIVHNFFTRDKYGQRRLLGEAGLPIPQVSAGAATALPQAEGQRFVVRPLRHSGGRSFRVTTDPTDFVRGTEYISELYPKRREYRIIFVYGSPLVVLRKKPNADVGDDQPWGHINSTFQTINDVGGSRIGGTDCIWRLTHFPVIQHAHIAAADILYNSKHPNPWVVLELNMCPSLQIAANRAKVVDAIRRRVGGGPRQ